MNEEYARIITDKQAMDAMIRERMRFEIAKELLSGRIASCCGNPYQAAKEAVNYADILIEELKKGGEK